MSRSTAPATAPIVVRSAWPVPAALSLMLLGMAGFLAWQYALPRAFDSSFLLDHAGAEHFRDTLGLPAIAVAPRAYAAGFRAFLAAIWIAYFVAVLAGGMGGPLPRRRAIVTMVVVAAAVATVLWPPSFSCDVYGYVAYGRLQAVYGLNPHATSQQTLIDLHDVTGPFLRWNIASPYGPLWTSVSVASAWLLRNASLFAQIVTMKAIAGAALVVAAWRGSHVAERLAPGRGDLTFLAIGLNPLFVIEGAGNGHNDLVMMAIVVVAIEAMLAGRTLAAVTWAGVAGAIKFLPLMLVPWIVWDAWRARRPRGGGLALDALRYGLAATLPITLAYWPYWRGARRTLSGLAQLWQSGAAIRGATDRAAWFQGGAVTLVYAATTLWFMRGERVRILTAWVVVAAAVYLVTTATWLPWYLSWMWIVALLGWDRRSATLSYLAFCFAVVMTLRYSVPGSN